MAQADPNRALRQLASNLATALTDLAISEATVHAEQAENAKLREALQKLTPPEVDPESDSRNSESQES